MITKRDLKDKNVQLANRIADLEERLCPCESHQWVEIDYSLVGGTGCGDETTVYHYKCKRCGKSISTRRLLKEQCL